MPFFTSSVLAAVATKPNAFITETAMLAANGGSLSTAGQPTYAEFQAAVTAASLSSVMAFYNGTDIENESTATHRMDVDSEGVGLSGSTSGGGGATHADDDVETVTGAGVNNTDARNPVVNTSAAGTEGTIDLNNVETGPLSAGYVAAAGTVATGDTLRQAVAKLDGNIAALGSTEHTAADVTSRNALTSLIVGDRVFVADASADSTVAAGFAVYRFKGGTGVSGSYVDTDFDKIAEGEGLDVSAIGGISDWTASTSYEQGQLVQESHRVMKAISSFTSAATFTAAEATNWTVVGQTEVKTWAASTIYVNGEQVFYNGNVYRNTAASFTSAATFVLGNFALEIEANEIKDWSADTRFEVGSLVKQGNMVLRRAFDVVGFGVSESTFDATEAARWEVISQEGYSTWAQNGVFVAGEKVLVNGEVYSRNTSGQDTATAIYFSASDWTLVASETQYDSYTDRLLSGHKDASTGTGNRFRITDYNELSQGFRYSLSDIDAANTSVHEIDLEQRSFGAGETYQFQLTIAESGLSNQVVEVGYSDAGGNSTTKLVNIGTGNIGAVAGGADAGNVTSALSVNQVNRGGPVNEIEINLILSWTGSSGATQALTVKPSYNVDGTAVEAVAATGSATVLRAKAGAVSDFPAASDVTATLIDSSASAVVETLPSATGSGAVLFYTNKDVQTNDARLIPAVGESISGATYTGTGTVGTFDFGVYADGTQFRVDDIAAGQWAVAVVGASTQKSLDSYFVRGLSADMDFPNDGINYLPLDLSSLVDGLYQVAREDNADGLRVGPSLTIQNAGKYRILYQANHSQDNESGTGGQNAFASSLAYRVNGGAITIIGQETDTNEIDGVIDGFETIDFAAGDVVEFGIKADDNRQDEDYLIILDVSQLPTTETVLSGMVEPITLDNARFSLSADSAGSAVCPFDTTDYNENSTKYVLEANGGVTVQPGRYLVTVKPGRQGGLLDWEVWNATAGSQVLNGRLDHAGTIDNTDHATGYLSLSAASEIQLRELNGDFAAVWNGTTELYGCTIEFVELPHSTVVDPDAVPVETLTRDFIELTANQNFTASYSDVLTLNLPAAGTYRVHAKVCASFDVGAGPNYARLTLDGVSVSGSEITLGDTDVGAGNWQGTHHTERVVTTTGPAVVALQAQGSVIGANIMFSQSEGNTSLAYEQLPSSTVVLVDPTFTEAKTLHYFNAGNDENGAGNVSLVSTDFANQVQISAYNNYDPQNLLAGDLVVIKQAGTYRVDWSLSTSDTDHQPRLYVNGAAVREYLGHNTIVGGGAASIVLDLSVGDTLGVGQDSATTDTRSFSMTVQQLPTEEVVTPGDVPVEDLHHASIGSQSASPSYSHTSGNAVQFSGDLVVDANGLISGNSFKVQQDGRYHVHGSFTTGTVASASSDTSIRVNGTVVARDRGNNDGGDRHNVDISHTVDLVAGDVVDFTHSRTVTIYERRFEITQLASKTVVNTKDTPTNDQAASGYFDIGDMRIQWGKVDPNNAGTNVITLPAPFANANYNVVASVNNVGFPSAAVTVHVNAGTETTTTFEAQAYFANSASSGLAAEEFCWQAIGLKP